MIPYRSVQGQGPATTRRLIMMLLCGVLAMAWWQPRPLLAQGSVRAWGLGGAYTAAARGLDAAAWNPANLALDHRPWALGLASAAVDLHNNAFTLSRYNEISGATLDGADKQRLLADIPADGFQLAADLRASLLGLRLGSFALTFEGLGGGSGRIDKDVFDLVLWGNEPETSVDFSDTRAEGYAVGAATLSCGLPVASAVGWRLSAGANLRYLQGVYEVHVEEAYGQLTTSLTEVHGGASVSLVDATGGQGYGLDLGLCLQVPRGWTVGLVADNLTSRVRWDGAPQRRVYTVLADSLAAGDEDPGAAITTSDTTLAIDPYESSLPRRLRLGFSHCRGSWLVACDLTQGLQERAGVTTRTAVSAGIEYRGLHWLRPRLGTCVGGLSGPGAAVGLGLGLGPWRLDLAAFNRGRLWPADTKGLALAAGTSLEF